MEHRMISVSHDALTGSVTAIEDAIDLIEFGLDQLEAQAAVLRSGWDGEAQRAFDVAHAKWDASLRELNAIARALSALAHSSNTRFHAHDRDAARAWQI